ncbi:hypothetical protein AMJ48_00725 [Parcubacteria bacterium DG_74_1]|nr:MAG: hypothetical protein AMJ48_00725 [Parcubacteria bacterium DG_74_1]
MKESAKLLLIGVFVLILALSLIGWWHYKSFERVLSEAKPFNLNFLEIDLEFEEESQELETFQEFLLPAGDLKISYSDSWQKIEDSEFSFATLDTENAKTLFYAIKVKAKETKMAWLIVQELNFGEERGLEKIIGEIKTAGADRGIETEIQGLRVEENMSHFRINQEQSGYLTTGEEKIILTKDNIYSILVFSLASDWESFQEEAEQILNSAQVLPTE